jgi:hypothetical protein
MKRLVTHFLLRTVRLRPRGAGAGLAPRVADAPVAARRRGPAADGHRLRWAGGMLAILFVLLAPWGGPCDRRTRAADPTTSGLSGLLGPGRGSQPGLHGSEYGSGIPETALDILDDEEDDGDEFGSRNLLDPSLGFTLKAHALEGPMARDRHHDDSGRSARSSLLRC